MSEDLLGLQKRAQRELERRMAGERGRYYVPNGGIEEFLQLMTQHGRANSKRTTIFILEAGNGLGKAHPKSMMFHTPDGFRRWGDIQTGDFVFGSDGRPTKVLAVHERGLRQTYRVEFDDGSATRTCADHLWRVRNHLGRRRVRENRGDEWLTLSTAEIARRGLKWRAGTADPREWEIPRHGPAEFRYLDVGIHPYLVGLWLGDGDAVGRLTTADQEVIDRINFLGYKFSKRPDRRSQAACVTIYGLRVKLRALGVLGRRSYEKSIPTSCLENSVEFRWELLRGLMDTDGTAGRSGGTVTFCSTSLQLVKDVVWLARSLGGKARIQAAIKKPYYRDESGTKVECRDAYNATITMPHDSVVFHIKRKQVRVKNVEARYLKRWISRIEPAVTEECSCITVAASDHLYLTNDFIVTHNTALAANIAAYITGKYPNTYLDRVPMLADFRRPNRGRILTTATAAQTAYDEELAKWMPEKRYRASKNGHKFNQYYNVLSTGSQFDILTFDQDPMQGESVTLDWAITDEPIPQRHFTALKARFRFGGFIIMILTPLEGSAWMQEQLLSDERLGKDVFTIRLGAEQNCITHGRRGIMPHEALESMWQDFDEDELAARKDGLPLSLSGAVLKTYRDQNFTDAEGKFVGHVMPELTGYWLECYEKGMFTLYNVVDPHDRKPFAVAWCAVFPNLDRVWIAEWPDDSMRLFHRLRSSDWGIEKYAAMIKATELAIAGRPADYRIGDPNFMNAMKATSKSTVLQEFIAAGREIAWPLTFDGTVVDDLAQGHIAMKTALGNPTIGVRPKKFVLAHCRNMRFGLKNYAYKESRDDSRGLSERPEYKHKDFPDLDRYFEMSAPRYIRRVANVAPPFQQKIFRAANGYVGV